MSAAFCAAVVLAALVACGAAPGSDRTPRAAQAALRTPADPHLADLYAHACRSCHVGVVSGAPLTGDPDDWRDRWNKGLPALLASAVQGFNGMPAGGQCARCTQADYEALIRFMAARETR